MLNFYLKVGIYLIMFVVSFYGLKAIDFNRFLKRNPGPSGAVLYILLALIMAYLLGEFMISITYYFNV